MKAFNRKESIWLLFILIFVFAVSFSNLRVSLRRARDVQRKNDIRLVSDSLVRYQTDFGSFPLSQDGKIVACKGPDTKKDARGIITGFIPCEWRLDSLKDVFDESYPPYVTTLPDDPNYQKGIDYIYFSDGQLFQIYAALEGKDEAEYDTKIVARGIICGAQICNFGLSYANTPLDKSLEEYQNELKSRK